MTDHDPGDELLARLREGDPAASLPTADPERVARLLEDAMSPETSTDSHLDGDTEAGGTGIRGRNPLTWLVAAAAVVLIAAAGLVTVLGGDDDLTAPPTAGSEPTVTELSMPPATAGRCMVPSARVLAGAAYAVAAEAVSIDDGVVTLDATEWYAGGPTDRVEVDQASDDAQALIGATQFEEGQRYLVAGTGDGQVMVCGFSGPHTPELAALYSQAFGS